MIKILVLDTGKEWGGGTNSLIELLKRIDKNKYKFSALFYENYNMGNSSDIKSELKKLDVEFILLKRIKSSFLTKLLKECCRLFFFFSKQLQKKYIFYVNYIRRILPDSRKIASILKQRDIDLLYLNNQASSNLEGILAAKVVGIPCVQHARKNVDLNPTEANAVNNGVERVICVSKDVLNSLVKSGVNSKKCIVVHNGIDTTLIPNISASQIKKELRLNNHSIIIGTAGSLVKSKRIHLFLNSIASLKGTINDISCLIIGCGPELQNLTYQAKKLGITEDVFFLGFSTNAISLINAMDLFVLPSEKEGLPRVILEAMLMTKPVIAFNVSGLPELVIDGETGFLLNNPDSNALAQKITCLIKDKDLRIKMGQTGRERVISQFPIEKYVSGVLKVFKEVIG